MTSEVQVVGLIRFSVLTSDPARSWQLPDRLEAEAYREALFADERLARRLEVFEAVALPSLDAQTDRDFTAVLLTSTALPARWRRRLRRLAAERDHLRIMRFDSEGSVGGFARTAVRRLRREGARIATFRLDDDDALGRDFVASLRLTASQVADGTIVSAPSGVFLRAAPEGAFEIIPIERANNAQGLSLVADAGRDTSVFSTGNHARLDPASVVACPCAAPSWLRSHHALNDSAHLLGDVFRRKEHAAARRTLDAAEARALLSPNFPTLDLDRVWRALQGPPGPAPAGPSA